MTVVLEVAAAAAGGAVGLGCGALGVWLERLEGLEAEEAEEREAYLAESARRAAEGGAEGGAAPWVGERYGWTWLERVLAPVLGAAGFAAFAAHRDFGGQLLIALLWTTLFVHVSVFDLKHRLILNRVTYPAVAVALALAPVSDGLTLRNAAQGAVLVYLFFMAQSALLGGSVLGMGDAKLGAIVGATTGLGFDADHLGAVYAVIAAVIAAGVVALGLLAVRLRGLRDPIPYGPFLCAGAALIIYHGPAGP